MRSLLLSLAAALVACTTSSPSDVDAGSDAAGPVDAGVHGIHWAMGPPLPAPIAYATAQLFPVGQSDLYLYVFGGSTASRSTLGTDSSVVYRARIDGDTLDAWESIGSIAPAGTTQGLVGHGILPINDAMGNPGAAIAGGGSLTRGALPVMLAIYCDRADGHLFDWSRFPPGLTDGQWFGVLAPIDVYDYALIGGIVNNAPTARVLYASTLNAATATTWTAVPSLPEARARHAYFVVNQQVYLLGGENNDGVVADIVRTTRDAAGAVSGWETVGTIDGAPVAHASFTYRGDAWLVGGVDGTTFDGPASARVRRAPIDASGRIGAFADEAETLPMPLAASAFATDFDHFFLVGGMSTPDLTATDAVIVGTVY